MTKKELLREKIEEERQKLNQIFADGGKVEDALEQNRAMEHLLIQYMDCE